MRLTTALAATCAGVAALVLLALTSAESRGSDSRDRTVAYVDVGRVLKECPRAREAEDRYRAAAGELRSRMRDLAKEHARKRADLVLVEGTEKHEAQEVLLDEEAWRIEYESERGFRKIEALRTKRIRSLLTAMGAEVRNIALRRGYDLVLSKNDGLFDLMEMKTTDQVLSMAASTGLLHGADHLDITDEILKALSPASPGK